MQPSTGQLVWYLFNTVNVAAFQATIEAFAREAGAGPDKTVILVLDNAGWHISDKITPPEGLHLFPLPPYSPELQPAERLWPLANEAIANRSFPDLEALDDALTRRCLQLCNDAECIRAHTFFSWWPNPA